MESYYGVVLWSRTMESYYGVVLWSHTMEEKLSPQNFVVIISPPIDDSH